MPVIAEQMKWGKPRNNVRKPISETESSPQISSTIQSTNCKFTISSFLSTFSNITSNETPHSNNNRNKKNNKFSAASTLRGFGCTAGASQEVSVPAVIRSSADWQGKKNRKKKHRKNKNKSSVGGVVVDDVPFNDVWCGPGIGFSTDAADASVDCVVTRKNVSSRGKFDGERISHRERSSYIGRRTINTESLSFLDDDDSDEDDDSDVFTTRSGRLECFSNARFYRHASHPSSHDGLAEIMIIQGRIMGGRFNSHDQFRDWRLDVDNMSYEQLLELGERIGYVNTGLKEDEMRHNIRKIKLLISNETSKHQLDDKECSICQEEYELEEELGRLNCEHSYHFQCIKQWLVLKNFCPVCKQQVVARHS